MNFQELFFFFGFFCRIIYRVFKIIGHKSKKCAQYYGRNLRGKLILGGGEKGGGGGEGGFLPKVTTKKVLCEKNMYFCVSLCFYMVGIAATTEI